MNSTTVAFLAVSLLAVWRIYRRIKRKVGRRKSVVWRHWCTAIFFPLFILMLGVLSRRDPLSLIGLLGGTLIGATLAIWNLRRTRYDASAEGFHYTPDAYVAAILLALFFGRVFYRALMAVEGGPGRVGAVNGFENSALTFLIIGVLAAHYAGYAIGILRWRGSLSSERNRRRRLIQPAENPRPARPQQT